VAALPMVTQIRCNSRENGLRRGILVEKLAKKRKSMAQSKLRTTTYVEVLACNRSDSGRYKFNNVRGAGSQGNV
jgi:hypothetical protein